MDIYKKSEIFLPSCSYFQPLDSSNPIHSAHSGACFSPLLHERLTRARFSITTREKIIRTEILLKAKSFLHFAMPQLENAAVGGCCMKWVVGLNRAKMA